MSCISNSSDINQTFIIEPLAIDDVYTTGATLIDSIVYFNRTDRLSAYTVNLTSFVTTDTYVTGMTFSNNTLTATRNDGINISANINTLTGLTVNGLLTVNGSLSATTFYGDGSHLAGITDTYVTGVTYSNNTLTTGRNDGANIKTNINSFTGLTVNGSLSATTFYGNGSHLSGITDTYVTGVTFTSNTLTITSNDGEKVSTNINSFTGLTVNGSLSATTIYGDGSHLTGISTGETYTNTNATTAALGGIASGATFSNRTMSQMWTDLLYPYQTPSFNSFDRDNLSTDYDLGRPILAGFQRFTWGTLNSGNVALNSIKIDQLQPTTVNVLSGSTNDFTQLVNLTGATISATTQTLNVPIYRITGTNTISSAFTRTITVNWKNRWYYGKNVNTSLTAAQITGLTTTNLVSSVVNTAITFGTGATSEYLYIAIPNSLGQPSDLRDSTTGCFGSNIPYSNIGTRGITNTYGVLTTYNVYRSTNQIASAQNVWLCS